MSPLVSQRDSARRKQTSKKDDGAPTSARRRVRVAEGIYKDRHGLAATVKVNGVQREVRFPVGTSLKIIRARRDELRASLRTLPTGERHTLTHDAQRYLDQVQSTLVSFSDRRRDLLAWLPRFGHLRTLSLPSHMAALNAQMHDWRQTLSAVSCNHRRHALTNLVRVLYGRRAAVELIDLVRFAPAPPQPRWIDRRHIAEVLGHLTPGSKTRVRLKLMHWTGMRPSQMGRLQVDDFRLDDPIPYVASREGRAAGSLRSHWPPRGIAAARAFSTHEPLGRGHGAALTRRSAGRPGARGGLRSPSTRSGMRSRRASGAQEQTWQTSRTCTGILARRRR